MERSSTIFAVSSHFYDNPHNQGRYHRAAGTPAVPHRGEARKGPATQTYTWIVEQELATLAKETSETRQWACDQQAYFGLLPIDAARRRTAEKKRSRDHVGPAGRDFDKETTRLRERLRAAEERCVEQSQLQEEFDKMEARWGRMGREERRRRQAQQLAEEQKAKAEKQKQQERLSQEEAWKAYERRWAAITSDHGGGQPLRFKSIPWPTTVPPRNVAEITPVAIAKFVFSLAHSEGVSRKERVRSALRRWHPDRFGRVLGRVDEKDKEAVERGVGIVARCLNELLAQEN
jgi:hypothetical protein